MRGTDFPGKDAGTKNLKRKKKNPEKCETREGPSIQERFLALTGN